MHENQLIPVELIGDLPHETIAQMIGSARKIVNLNLQQLKREKVIVTNNGKLYVTDLSQLISKAKI